MNAGLVIDILKDRQLLTSEQAEQVLNQAADSSKDIAQLIVDTGALDRSAVFGYIAQNLGLDHFDLKGHSPAPEIIAAIPAATAVSYTHLTLPTILLV